MNKVTITVQADTAEAAGVIASAIGRLIESCGHKTGITARMSVPTIPYLGALPKLNVQVVVRNDVEDPQGLA